MVCWLDLGPIPLGVSTGQFSAFWRAVPRGCKVAHAVELLAEPGAVLRVRQPFSHVRSLVVAARHTLQIFQPVVAAVPVDVVDVESVWDGAVGLLPHVPVHVDGAAEFGVVCLVVSGRFPVESDVSDALNGVLG